MGLAPMQGTLQEPDAPVSFAQSPADDQRDHVELLAPCHRFASRLVINGFGICPVFRQIGHRRISAAILPCPVCP